MSKRSAQGPQGSKEDENAFTMSSTPDEKPQRATAAQMASRKIKDVRRRPRAATPAGGVPASQPSGAFSSLSAAPSFPTSGFSAPSTQPTGFAFGQSQSFPGASSAPSQANQDGPAPFSFGGSGSTGFNFSSGLTSNPFASSSFNASTSAPTQPASSAGTTGFVGFGNQAAAPPSISSGLFGAQQNPTTSTPNAPIFGQAATSSAANSASDSMETSPDAKPKAPSFNADSSVQKNLFGGAGASNLFSPKPATAPASNPFGGLNTSAATDKPSSDKAEGLAAKPAFSAQPNGPTSQAQPFDSLFGASSATSAASEPEKAKTPQPAMGNLFAPKPAEQASNPFAPKPASSEAEKPGISQPAPNNLFSPQPAAGTASGNLFASKSTADESSVSATTSQPFKNLFGASGSTGPTFGSMSPSKPASEQAPVSNLFAPKPPADGQSPDKAPDAQSFKSLFGTTPATSSVSAPEKVQPTAPAATPSLFSQKPAAEGKPAESQPFKSLFGATPATSQTAEAAKPQSAPSLFAPKPATAQDSDKPAASQPFGSLFGSAATSKPSETTKPQPAPAAPTSPFAAKPSVEQASTDAAKPNPSQPFGTLFGAKPPAPEPKAAQAPVVTSTGTTSAKSLADQIPKPDLPAPAGKVNEDAEMLWKVRSLDHFFKQELLNYEPGTHSFDSLILFYMNARHAMGAPVKPKVAVKLSNGSHTNLATPRQPNNLATKAPPAAPAAPAANPNASATSNLFSQSFSSSPAHSADKPSSKEAPTVSAFPPAPKANPFASLSTGNATTSPTAKAPNAAPPAAPKLGDNIFGNAQSSGTQGAATAPGIPKFGNGVSGTDFMAQFKKKAEQSMAEEKAKRKAEDFDSDEDDEAEWERRDAEKQREKRAKLEDASKKTIFVPGEGFKFVDADEATASDSATSASQPAEKSPLTAASPAPSSASIFESSSRPLSNSENIFGRLSATPQPSDTGKDSDESDNEGKTPSPKRRASEDDEGDFAAALRKSKRAKPSDTTETTKSSLDTPLPAPTAAAGRSLFDRVESPAAQESATSNLFSASLNKATASPSDNTWKPNSPIKFSSNPSPFSALSTAPTPATTSTQASSAENATSGDATPDEEAAPGAIFDMSNANAGEEEEEVVFECRARAFKLATGWASQGTGVVRLLKHPATGRSRIVLRADPGGNVILNTLLKKEFEYSRASNSVQFMVPQANNQKPEHWAIRVKAESIEPLHNKIQGIKY